MEDVCGSLEIRLDSEIVRVVYTDESGISGSTEEQPLCVVAGIMINMDSQWRQFEHDLLRLKHDIPRGLLAHGHNLKGKRLFWGIRKGFPEAEKTLTSLLSLAVKHRIPIFHAVTDREGLKRLQAHPSSGLSDEERSYDAIIPTFHLCMARVDTYVRTSLPKELVLWIAGKTARENIIKAQHLWLKMNKLVVSWKNVNLDVAIRHPPDYLSSPLQIADTIYFGDMIESLPLQFAHVCCSVIANYLMKRPEAEPFYNIIREQIVHSGSEIAYEWLKDRF